MTIKWDDVHGISGPTVSTLLMLKADHIKTGKRPQREVDTGSM